jgi:glutamate-1-semialdehyde 2,1-aminomutase
VEQTLKTVAIVQARMGSTRFPKKVMRTICGTPMIGLVLKRLSNAKLVDQIVLATSENPRDDMVAKYVQELGYTIFRGSEEDVLDRYYRAAKEAEAELVVRVTGDCPLIDPVIVDETIMMFLDSDVDYASNNAPPTFPHGLDAEVFTFQALEEAWGQSKTPQGREHVTPYITESGKFRKANHSYATDYSEERWTVDEPEDFEVVQKVFEYFNPEQDFSWLDVLSLVKKHPEWFMANRHIVRDEGWRLDVE